MEEIIQLDHQVFLYLNNLGTPTWDGFWMFITGKWNSIPLYIILLYLLYKKTGIKATLITVFVIGLMIGGTDQLANLFKKVLFLRPRPCHDEVVYEAMRLVKSYCGGKYGYFSGHASSSIALAVFLGKIFKPHLKYLGGLLLVWAVFVGYSRIYIGVHYPGDVLTGMFFGVLIALLFYKLQQYLIYRFLR